jgi:hypothetical protein
MTEEIQKRKNDIHKRIRKLLEKDFEGYVLVTCKPAGLDGKMQVEMSYEGDPVLAAYLMEGAQEYLDEEEDSELELLS